MSGEVSISNRQKRVSIDAGKIRRAAKKILSDLGFQGYELSIVIVDDREITRLNRQYFHRNRPTNVISFPMAVGDPASLHSRVLGDVVISAETSKRQAEEAGRKAKDEILFLLIHGVLHLAGYDHEGAADERKKMEAKEKEFFNLLIRPGHRK